MVEGQETAESLPEVSDKDATTRLCAVSRTERPLAELIRFVAGPDAAIVPDLNRKLPGRGVWVTADRASVEAAVKGKAFAKSLKRQVSAAADLAERVEALLVRRLEQSLAIANKAGLVVFGFQKLDVAIERGTIAVLVHGSDAAPGGRDKLDRKFQAIAAAKGSAAPVVDLLSIAQISLAMGRENVVHAGLTQGGATDRVLSDAERVERYLAGFATSA